VRHGTILVDKPSGPTSHDIVEIVRHALGVRQVGHMGTLDPLATGLLLVGVGEATKLTPFLSGLDKTYECTARLGARSSTYDAMGTIETVADPVEVDRERIEEALEGFRGSIEQAPPPFSAVKVKGQPMYKYARRGEKVEPKPRRVRVHRFEIVNYAPPDLEIHLRVSSGTYVRSLVHDLGEKLDVGAYVSRLRRTAIGSFSVADAIAVHRLEACATEKLGLEAFATEKLGLEARATGDGVTADDFGKAWRSLAESLGHLASVRVPEELVGAVCNGGIIAARGLDSPHAKPAPPQPDDLCALLDDRRRLLAVARCLVSRGDVAVHGSAAQRGDLVFKPVRVFTEG